MMTPIMTHIGVWRFNMWVFLSVIVVCATVLYWSDRYITPVNTNHVERVEDVKDADQPINFDNIIAEIYDRLEEDA